jgi:hypothetical protein
VAQVRPLQLGVRPAPAARRQNPTDHIDEALATVAQQEGKTPQSVVARLGKRTRVSSTSALPRVALSAPRRAGFSASFPVTAGRPRALLMRRRSERDTSRLSATARPRTEDRRAGLAAARAGCGAQGRGAEFCRDLLCARADVRALRCRTPPRCVSGCPTPPTAWRCCGRSPGARRTTTRGRRCPWARGQRGNGVPI